MGAIRLFLALAVLQSHIAQHFLLPVNLYTANTVVLGVNGGYAVAFFFVISSFLISFVLEEKYERPGGTVAFYRARALRIYPLWWCLYLIAPFVTEPGLWQFVTSRHLGDLLSGFFLYGSDWLLSFKAYPDQYTAPMPHGLELGWTLATELTFYLIAPFVLRSRLWPLAILVGSVLLRVWLNIEFPPDVAFSVWNNWCYYFFPALAFFFMLGHLSRQVHKRFPLPPVAGWVGLGVAALICLIQDGKYYYDNVYFYAAIAVFAVALPAIFDASKDNRFSNFLGDLAYPLYLSHGILIAVIETRLPQVQQAIAFAATDLPGHSHLGILVKSALISGAFWVPALFVALAVHVVIEKPAARVLRWGFAAYDAFRHPPTRGGRRWFKA